jgi:hypothetical protein
VPGYREAHYRWVMRHVAAGIWVAIQVSMMRQMEVLCAMLSIRCGRHLGGCPGEHDSADGATACHAVYVIWGAVQVSMNNNT